MSNQTGADELRLKSLKNAAAFIIMKASRLPTGYGGGYSGPACSDANIQPGMIYTTLKAAQHDAKLLSAKNPAGFEVWGAGFNGHAIHVELSEFSKVSNAPLLIFVFDPFYIHVRLEYEIGSTRSWMQILPHIEADIPIEFVLINGVKYKPENSS